jgi:hypothetical protein
MWGASFHMTYVSYATYFDCQGGQRGYSKLKIF